MPTFIFSGVRVTRSLVLYVCIVDRCLSFCTFSFGHCVVYSSSIYGFGLPLWYLQTLPKNSHKKEYHQLIYMYNSFLSTLISYVISILNLWVCVSLKMLWGFQRGYQMW